MKAFLKQYRLKGPVSLAEGEVRRARLPAPLPAPRRGSVRNGFGESGYFQHRGYRLAGPEFLRWLMTTTKDEI